MARSLFSVKKGPDGAPAKPSPSFGLTHAIKGCLTDTECILAGQCDVTKYLLRDFADFEVGGVRIPIVRALLRCVVYLLNVCIWVFGMMTVCAKVGYPSY